MLETIWTQPKPFRPRGRFPGTQKRGGIKASAKHVKGKIYTVYTTLYEQHTTKENALARSRSAATPRAARQAGTIISKGDEDRGKEKTQTTKENVLARSRSAAKAASSSTGWH